MGWQDDPIIAPAQKARARWENDPILVPAVNVQQRSALIDATLSNPDQAAEAASLAKRYGLPPGPILGALPEVKARAAVEDASAKLGAASHFARFVANKPFVLKQAIDDLDALGAFEKTLIASTLAATREQMTHRSAPAQDVYAPLTTAGVKVADLARSGVAGATRGVGSVVGGAGELLDVGARNLDRLFRFVAGDTAANAMWFDFGPDLNAALNPAQALKTGGAGWKLIAEGVSPPKARQGFDTEVAEGIGQLAQQIAVQVATGGTASLATLFAQGADQMVEKTKNDPAPQALKDAATLLGASTTALTEKFGLDMILGRLPPAIKNAMLRWVADTAVAAGIEASQEVAEGLLQDAIRIALTNPDAQFGEGILHEASVAGVSAAIVRAVLGIRRGARDTARIEEADIRVQQLAQMFNLAAASKLRERNAGTFQEFAQAIADDVDGAPKSVFVDAARLAEVFNQAGITEEQFVEMLPTGAQQMQSALASGGVVELPIGELMARVAGTGLEKQLLPHLRVEPDALSQIEAQEAGDLAQEFLQSEFKNVIDAAADQTAVQASAEAVKQTVLSQLTTANRFTADVNEAYSTLVRDFYTATSSRLGITPEQMYDRYPLRVSAANAPAAKLPVTQELAGVQDNASGESSASLEAQNRNRQELESGRLRVLVNEDGTARILRGVDAVDQRARKGQVIVQRGVGAAELAILEVGKGARKDVQARALIAAKKRIDEELAALPPGPIPVGEAEELKQSARTGGDIARIVSADQTEPFYSELARQVERVNMNAAPASGWKMWLKGLPAKGVKPDEIEWSGLPEFLDMAQGKITKQAVLDYLNANGVRVTETVLGNKAGFTQDQQERLDELENVRDRTNEEDAERQRLIRAENNASDSSGNTNLPKFATHQLPGGSNYREVLLTLPNKLSGQEARYIALQDLPKTHTPDQAAEYKRLGEEIMLAREREKPYRSTHWDQPNVLAHIRLNDRTDADGKRVLFVEEIQSDWGQAGKKKGFQTPDLIATKAVKQEAGQWEVTAADGRFITNVFGTTADTEQGAIEEANRRMRENPRATAVGERVPAAPFVGKTDAWVALALKRVIKLAVDEGYDTVAFVNGEQSADRYDLSKQVDSVAAHKNPDGTYYIQVERGGSFVHEDAKVPEAKLPDLLGKDLAEKIVAQRGDEEMRDGAPFLIYRGLDLKVGGDGMRAFYDKIVPSVLKDVLRKVGGGQTGAVQVGGEAEWGVFSAEGAPLETGFTTRSKADAVAQDYAGSVVKNEGGSEQPGFTLTDSMREKAAGGLPLFQSPVGASGRKATQQDFTKEALPELLGLTDWAILTAEDPGAQKAPPEANAAAMAALTADLEALGVEHQPVVGKYGDVQRSVIVTGIAEEQAAELGRKYGQESVLTRRGLVYMDGRLVPATGVQVFDTPPDDFYTEVPGTGAFFSVDLDFAAEKAAGNESPAVGVHYSGQARTVLNGRMWGTGLRGAERERLNTPGTDPRLRERLAFYIDVGRGVSPEAGVGGVAHEAALPPLYDADVDPLRLVGGGPSAFESRVIDAGFAGYWTRKFTAQQGAAVLLGEGARSVEARQIPNPATGYAPPAIARPYKRALMREELAKLDIAAVQTVAPSAALRAGTFQVDEAQLPMARDALAAQGITLPDSGTLAQGPRGSFNPKSLNIKLLQNADLSTFLHESGHFFLEVLADVAAQPGAPADVAADMGAVLSWFGVKDVDTWNGMKLDEQRKHHERFAEAFEQYLFTGKAPSKELQPAFRRFRSWLVNVYKSLSAFLRGHDTQLTDEVRAVFDRMLATDAQIEETEAELSMLPHDDATLTAVETLQARSLRDLKWTLNATSKELKRLQADVEEKRKTVRAEMTEVVRQRPEYAVQRWLKTGVLPDGVKSEGGKLSTAALKEMYGDGPAAPWRYVATNMLAAEDGLPPGVVADLFGFANGDAMVRAIVGAEQEAHAIDGMTDKALLERYGDLATPAGMQRAAQEAVHNEARARFVASQLKALAEGMNPREEVGRTRKGHAITVNALVGAAKQFAERVVAERRVLDLKPAVFTAAEARAAKKADKAQAAGDVQAAIAAKREQLLNHYTAKRVMEAQGEVEKTLSYLKKFDKDTIRAKLSVDYLDQIDKLLERFDLRKGTSARDIDRRASLLEWVAAQEELGLQPVVPDALLNEARSTSYKQLTVEEFRGLADTVRNIEHLGRLKNKLLKAKDAREFAAIVGEIEQSIRGSATTTREPRVNAPTQVQRALDTARDFLSSHRKVSSIIRQLDGFKDNGPFWRAFVQTMNESADQEAVLREQATKRLAPIFTTMLKTGRLGELAVVPGLATSLSLETRLVVALNWGNTANRQRVMDGDKWSEQQVNAILSTLTKPQLEFVQNVWAAIDEYWPAIKAKEERVSGLAPEKVEALPFVVNLADGTSVDMPGGYYPIKYDPDKSSKAEADTAAELTKQMLQGQYTRATTRRGHTKARVDTVNRAVRKDINVVFEHTTQVIHDLSWHEWLIDATRLLRAGGIDSAVRETMGPEMLRELKRGVEDIAAGDVPAQSGFERGLNHMRQGVTIVGLGWNLMTGLLQPLGITQSMSRIGVKWVGKGLSRWVGDAVRMENAVARVYDQSSFMRLRGETFNRELNEIRNKVHGNKLSAVETSYFYLIQKLQIVADMPTWLGQYEKSMAEMDGDETTSIALADQAVRDSQTSGHLSDLARIQRGGPLQKLFTTFYSYFSAAYNTGVESYRRTKFNDPLSVGVFAADMLLLAIVPSVLATLMRAALTGGADDEEELIERLWRDQLNYLLGTMVGLREMGAAVQGFSGYQGPAGTRFFSEVAKLTKQAGEGEADAAFLKALNNTGGILFHYPAGQVNRTVEGFLALQEGETKNPLVLLVGPPKE